MQEKLVKLLKIKIDSINRNIDNLNYLNGELDKNNENLNYIREKIKLFSEDEILNFDQIDKTDFDQLLFMLDSKVRDEFQTKTCAYQGIIYIIQGIRQGISLELTPEQTNAILTFKNGLIEKEENLINIIQDLTESKERLPEINLSILTNDLEKYQDIISKLENNLYLTEIDDVILALDFSNVQLEEKIELFEYILKYNSSIYLEQKKEDIANENNQIENHEFNYEPINLQDFDTLNMPILNAEDLYNEDDNENNIAKNDLNVKLEIPINYDDELEKEENEDDEYSEDEKDFSTVDLEDIIKRIDEKLKDLEKNKNNVLELEKEENEEDINKDISFSPILENDNENNEINEFMSYEENFNNFSTNLEDNNENLNLESKLDNNNTNNENNETNEFMPYEEDFNNFSTNLEDNNENLNLDSKLDDNTANNENNEINEFMSYEEVKTEMPIVEDNFDINNNKTQLMEVLNKFNLSDLLNNVDFNQKINVSEVDNIFSLLNENKILELLNKNILCKFIQNANITSFKLEELFDLVRNNFVSKELDYQYVLNTITLSMPILLTDKNIIDTLRSNIEFFKEQKINLIHLFDNYRELLIVENDKLNNNYNKIKNYDLKLDNDNVKYLLYKRDVIENLDYYIEAMGYEKGFLGSKDIFDGLEYIKKHPHKLNTISQDTLMKLRFSSENDMKIYGSKPGILAGEISNPKVDLLVLTPEYKKLYFNHEYSFLDRSELLSLLDELDNDNSFDLSIDESINLLDSKYKVSDLRYKIEEIWFSRIKTIRLYNCLKKKGIIARNALILALTYNTVIKQVEFDKISELINSLLEGGE